MRHTPRRDWALTFLTLCASFAMSSGCSESRGDGSAGTGATPSSGSAGDVTSGGFGGSSNELGGNAGSDAAGTGGNAAIAGAGTAGNAGDALSAGSSGTGGGGETSGGTAGAAGTSSVGLDCVPTGSVSYTLVRNDEPISAEAAAYVLITRAMDLAVAYYNCYTDLSLALEVHFDATFAIVETQGTVIRFGAMDAMNPVTAMHEIAGIAGIGSPEFAALVDGGVFTGENATAELRAITGDDAATLYADADTFWPYGLNYPNEVKDLSDLENHCRLVVAIRKDLGR